MELTDGWYAIKTILDKPLSVLVRTGQITVGQKLFISGAELTGSQEAFCPLEVISLIICVISLSKQWLFLHCDNSESILLL